MNKEISDNKSVLSEIPGGFAIMPNALIGFISDKACTVFLKIYQCYFMLDKVALDGEEWIQVSGPFLTTALQKKNRNCINDAINELVGLNIIKSKSLNRKQVLYCINWNEIVLMCDVLCKVNFEGRKKFLETCVRNKFIPMSEVSDEIRNEIIRTYPNELRSYENDTNPPMFVTKSYEPSNVRNEIIRTENDSYENDTNLDEDNTDEQMPAQSTEMTENDNAVRMKMIRKNDGSYENDTNESEIRIKSVHNIYKEKNKKEMRERSSQYIGGKEEKLLEYFSSRNLELPVFDKTLYESFLETDLDDSDDDVVKGIKTVWNQLGYDEELPDNNFIDLETFQNILFHSWEQLKQDYPDYSLSEKDFKNIFGFIILEHEGEPCLYIDPSKLQDVTANSQPVPEKRQDHKFSDRTSRRLFIDCINEIADKDDQLLTTSEFVALLLIDYATEHSSSAFSVELTKLSYEDLLKDLSERANIPVEDIRWLFKELPQKHKVKISPQQLLPDKFFQYNREHGEESKVEELLRNRLEEV